MSEVSEKGQDILEFLRVKDGSDKDGSDKIISKMVETLQNEIQEIQNDEMHIVNITKTMEDLTQIGELLQVANKTSVGFKCNVAIKKILYKYQILLGLCVSELDYFKQSTRHALTSHIEAVECIDDNEFMEALLLLGDCTDIATELAEKAKDLATKSEELTEDSGKALAEATEQDVANKDKQLELTVARQQMNAKKAMMDKLEIEYANEVAEYRKNQADAVEKADTESSRAFVIGMIGAVFSSREDTDNNSSPGAGPVVAEKKEEEKEKLREDIEELENDIKQTNKEIKEKTMEKENEQVTELKKQLKTQSDKKKDFEKKLKGLDKFIDRLYTQAANNAAGAEANVARITEILREKRDAEIENKAELAKLACEIGNSDMDLTDISTAIQMINLTMLTLGRVSTSMNNTAQFWRQQAQQCATLAKLGNKGEALIEKYEKTQKDSFLKRGKKAIKTSGMTWLTLYVINSEAVVAIGPAKEKIDKVMSALGGFQSNEGILVKQSKEDILVEAKQVLEKIVAWNTVESKAIESTEE